MSMLKKLWGFYFEHRDVKLVGEKKKHATSVKKNTDPVVVDSGRQNW